MRIKIKEKENCYSLTWRYCLHIQRAVFQSYSHCYNYRLNVVRYKHETEKSTESCLKRFTMSLTAQILIKLYTKVYIYIKRKLCMYFIQINSFGNTHQSGGFHIYPVLFCWYFCCCCVNSEGCSKLKL